MANNFQRLGSTSNSHVGRDFETAAQDYFREKGISRAFIGPRLADALDYPKGPTLGVLFFFRLEDLYHRILSRIFPNRSQGSALANFTSLLEMAVYDSAGSATDCPTTYTRKNPASGEISRVLPSSRQALRIGIVGIIACPVLITSSTTDTRLP